MLTWLFGTKKAEPVAPRPTQSIWSTHQLDRESMAKPEDVIRELVKKFPRTSARVAGAAQDDFNDGSFGLKLPYAQQSGISDALAFWYINQGFIGWQMSALIAQHWLINKACSMPAKDAIRKGYNVVSVDGEDLPPDYVKLIHRYDKAYGLNRQLFQFLRKGRIFGIRIVLFKINSTDPEYYEKPFNIDGVTKGSYKGIVQVDPYWCAPQLDGNAAAEPDTAHFYEPTFWIINDRKYHRSHLIIYRHDEPVDMLKPAYLYGGVPVPQQIMERVYAAERTANEAPQLAMTKRVNVWRTDMAQFIAAGDKAIKKLVDWAQWRDNYGVKLGDKEADEFQQFDTSLADLDAVIMTQYQIVAAAANVPATKLLGTTPKGFNSTGDYEEASYHEELESIQTHDLTPLVERHHALVVKSSGMDFIETAVAWNPLDAPTAKELADTNLSKAQAGLALIQSGAISSEDERERLSMDPDSGYHGLGVAEELGDEGDA